MYLCICLFVTDRCNYIHDDTRRTAQVRYACTVYGDVHMCAYIYIYIYIYIDIHVYVYACMYMCVCVCM